MTLFTLFLRVLLSMHSARLNSTYILLVVSEIIRIQLNPSFITKSSHDISRLHFSVWNVAKLNFKIRKWHRLNSYQTCSVSCDSYVSNMTTRIYEQILKGSLTDCIIVAEAIFFRAHKLIQANSSEYFKVS